MQIVRRELLGCFAFQVKSVFDFAWTLTVLNHKPQTNSLMTGFDAHEAGRLCVFNFLPTPSEADKSGASETVCGREFLCFNLCWRWSGWHLAAANP
jgi:hypothetical protein